jgi:hypothetical protein
MNHLQTLTRFNAWRRGDDDIEQPDPKAIGEAIDWAVSVCQAAQSLKDAKGRHNAKLTRDRLFAMLP